MRYFIMALLLHALLFFKLSMTNDGPDIDTLGVKQSVAIQFQQVSVAPPPPPPPPPAPAPAAVVEKPVEKVIEKPIEKPKERPTPKKNTTVPKKEEKREEKPVVTENTPAPKETGTPGVPGVEGGVAGGVPGGVLGGILESNGDGTYNALSGHGIQYKIIREIEPEYPKQAENIRYRKRVVVKARFLVDEFGNVKNISIINSHARLGFDQAVITALNRWKFSPIVYEGRTIRVYFQKEFIFEPKM